MRIVKVNEINSFQNAHGVDARKIFETKDAEVIYMTLSVGQTLKRHTTPVNVFFYVLEGKGVVEVGDESQEVEKDAIIDSPKGIPHLLRNSGEGVFRFLVVKLPNKANP